MLVGLTFLPVSSAVSLFFCFSFFIFHWFFSQHVWPCWPLSLLPHQHHDPNHTSYGRASLLQYAPQYIPVFISPPQAQGTTTLTSCSPAVVGTRPCVAPHHPHITLLWPLITTAFELGLACSTSPRSSTTPRWHSTTPPSSVRPPSRVKGLVVIIRRVEVLFFSLLFFSFFELCRPQ